MAYPACAVAFVGGVPSLFPAGAPLPGGTAAASAVDAQIKVELKAAVRTWTQCSRATG